MRIYKLSFVFLLAAFWFPLNAQSESAHIRKGNEFYKEGKFNDAEVEYRKALGAEKLSWNSVYNLSNALYKQKRYKEAEALLDSLAERTRDKGQLSDVYHNLGNSLLNDKNYAKSIEVYKKAMKLDPNAEDTRYNLSYALKMKQKQDQQQQQSKQTQKPQKPKQDKQEQEKPEEQKTTLNKEDAKRVLDELTRKEQERRKELEKNTGRETQPSGGKDW